MRNSGDEERSKQCCCLEHVLSLHVMVCCPGALAQTPTPRSKPHGLLTDVSKMVSQGRKLLPSSTQSGSDDPVRFSV